MTTIKNIGTFLIGIPLVLGGLVLMAAFQIVPYLLAIWGLVWLFRHFCM